MLRPSTHPSSSRFFLKLTRPCVDWPSPSELPISTPIRRMVSACAANGAKAAPAKAPSTSRRFIAPLDRHLAPQPIAYRRGTIRRSAETFEIRAFHRISGIYGLPRRRPCPNYTEMKFLDEAKV